MMGTIHPEPVSQHPRWYGHSYNRVGLYWLAEQLGRAPRWLRLLLARQLGQLAPRFLPAERQAGRGPLAAVPGRANGRRDRLAAAGFRRLSLLLRHLVSTSLPARGD